MTLEVDPRREKAVLHLLQNMNSWVGSRDLAKAAGYDLAGTRVELRQAMRVAIFRGLPIITGSKGFMWASQPNQLLRAAERLERRAEEIRARANALRACKDRLEAQKKGGV
jgi:hypothetical protein